MCLLALQFVEQVLTVEVAYHAHVAFISHNSRNTELLPTLSVIRTALLPHPHQHIQLLVTVSPIYTNTAPYTVDLSFVCVWGLNIEVFAGVSLQRSPASILLQ